MAMPVIVKVWWQTDGRCQRLSLAHGLPESLQDLMAEVKNSVIFRLQYMDLLFGIEFMNLISVSEVEVEDRGTPRVIDLSTPTMQHESSTVLPLQTSSPWSANDSSSLSVELVDTDVLSSDESTSSRSSWPAVFHVPKFSYDAELKLQ